MEIHQDRIGIKNIIDAQMALITVKHGENAAKLAHALLMTFAANSTNDSYKDRKIAQTLAKRVKSGDFFCDNSQGISSFGWKDNKGKINWMFTTMADPVHDLDQLFRPISRKVRHTIIINSDLTDQIIIAASEIHRLLGLGPVYKHESLDYHDDSDYRNFYGHLTRTAKNVAELLSH